MPAGIFLIIEAVPFQQQPSLRHRQKSGMDHARHRIIHIQDPRNIPQNTVLKGPPQQLPVVVIRICHRAVISLRQAAHPVFDHEETGILPAPSMQHGIHDSEPQFIVPVPFQQFFPLERLDQVINRGIFQIHGPAQVRRIYPGRAVAYIFQYFNTS